MFYTTDDLREEVPDFSNECDSALNEKTEKIEEWSWLNQNTMDVSLVKMETP